MSDPLTDPRVDAASLAIFHCPAADVHVMTKESADEFAAWALAAADAVDPLRQADPGGPSGNEC